MNSSGGKCKRHIHELQRSALSGRLDFNFGSRVYPSWFVGTALGLLVGVAGCSKEATPIAPSSSPLGQEPAQALKLPGLSYWNERRAEGPWSIHVVKIDRSRQDLRLRTTIARNTVLGLSSLSQQIRNVPASAGKVVAAINGDFYVVDQSPYQGDPRGLQILAGEVVSSPGDQVACWIDAAGEPHAEHVDSKMTVALPDGATFSIRVNEERGPRGIVLYTPRLGPSTRTVGGKEYVLDREGSGPWLPLEPAKTYTAKVMDIREGGNASLKGDHLILSAAPRVAGLNDVAVGSVVKISTATAPDLPGVQVAIGGGNIMVRGGKLQEFQMPSSGAYKYRSVLERHPRSAIGFNATHIFLVEVDGRQPDLSIGMTLRELGQYMRGLGCVEAMNFDGGGSSTLWVDGRVVNSPSNGGERDIGNALVIVRTPTTETK